MIEGIIVETVPLMFALIAALIAWIGKRLHDKMDDLGEQLSSHRTESERRITRVETSIDHIETRLEHIETKLNK